MKKPQIIVLSKDTDTEGFKWMSVGWNDYKHIGTSNAKKLMTKAHKAIDAAENVIDAIQLLKKAGFEIVRN